MKCGEARRWLDAVTEGEVRGWLAWRVSRHLASCASCTEEVEEIRRLRDSVREWRNVAAPAHLKARIDHALHSAPGDQAAESLRRWETPAKRNPPMQPLRTRPLLVALLGLVLSLALPTALVIGVTSYIQSWQGIRFFSDAYIQNAAVEAANKTQSFLEQALPTLELNRDLAVHDPQYGVFSQRQPGDGAWRARAQLFLRVLRAHPQFYMVHFGDRWGSFTGASRRANGEVWVEHRWLSGGRSDRLVYQVRVKGGREEWILIQAPRVPFDPRQRPWYRLAQQRRRLVWAGPYLFASIQQPGITAALPLLDSRGEVDGVFGVDYQLIEVSGFVKHLKGGRTFLLTGDGREIMPPGAGPEPASSGTPSASDLPLATHSTNPVLRAAALSWAEHSGQTSPVLTFESGGVRYLGAFHPFEVGNNLKWSLVEAIPEENILRPLRRNSLYTVGLCVLVLMVNLLVGAALSLRISRPLRAFAREMEQVAQLVIPTEHSPPSHIEEVQSIGETLEQVQTSLRSFEKYVPADLVRILLQTGQEARLGGQTSTMTLFFADVVGFTAISEGLSPTELVDALADYLEEMEAIISHNDGIVDKYIGDAVMAFWGAPIRPESHPESKACAAALEYVKRFQLLRAEREAKGRPFFEAHIGIHTGEALVGNIGSQRRMNYTAMGDTVNLASHLEHLNRVYGTRILIGGSTYNAVQDDFEAREIDCVALKGRTAAIHVYELLARGGEVDSSFKPLLEAYAEGLRLYRSREWEAALEQFQRAEEMGDRGPSPVMAARCREYLHSPPPPDWKGVYMARGR